MGLAGWASDASLPERLTNRLRLVRRRQYRWIILRAAIRGLFVGALAGFAGSLILRFGADVASWGLLVAPMLGLLLGVAYGALHPPDWDFVARRIDQSHQLQDRTLTAWHFAQRDHPSALQRLQMRDAAQHLQQIDPQAAVTRSIPQLLPWSLLLWGLTAVLVWLPSGDRSVLAQAVPPDQQIVRLAKDLEQTILRELEELADRAAPDSVEQRELQELLDELAQRMDAMQQPGTDRADALAELSEMQAALAALDAKLDLDELQGNFRELGALFESTHALESIGKMLQEQRFESAAKQLTTDPTELVAPQEARTLAEQLQPLAVKMRQQEQPELAEATDRLGKALQEQDPAAAEDAAKGLAKLSQQMALRMELAGQLNSQAKQLAEAKAFSLSGGKSSSRSEQPRQTWGRGTAGDPQAGESTSLASQRERQEVSGTLGEGPSQREVVRTDEGRPEQAQRDYRDLYPGFRRQAEDVLRHEPLPLGHRRMIRQYFEAIRPGSQPAEP